MGHYSKHFYQFKNPFLKVIRKITTNLLLRKCTKILFLGNEEQLYFQKIFKKHSKKSMFFRFRIDEIFWNKKKSKRKSFKKPYILFIGNDSMRDYNMLLNIANELPYIQIKIVSNTFSKIFKNLPKNISIIGYKKKN